ncbi:DUF3325 domain-containing protein [Ottowia sp.]|uniref:DUF3325 domain-containing protein n=1 Tax=Ottowia sp. TaxID=1898956 RepID=UPI003A8C7F06
MTGVLLMALAFVGALSAFLTLSLAMERHFQDVFGRHRRDGARWQPWLRAIGWVALGASLLICLALDGPTRGWVLWLGVLTVAALAQVLLLTYGAPHLEKHLKKQTKTAVDASK